MDVHEYRIRGKEMVDYIANYMETIRERRVLPDKKPGFLREEVPESAPVQGESWPYIFKDVEGVIMPGLTHWQSPHNHAYFPSLGSYPSLLGDMLADAINTLGFTWASCPVQTELEMIVVNWLGKMIGLPDTFLHSKNGVGGGVLQTTTSESTLVCLLAARTQAIRCYQQLHPEEDLDDNSVNGKLIAYASDQAHSSIEKGSLIALVKLRYIESDENLSMRGEALAKAINEDRELGLVPFWVCATLGTTGACAFDNLEEIGKVCQEERMWLHIDAAYAGSAFVCPEFRGWIKGIEKADSLALNASKWFLVNFDISCMWVKNSLALHRTFNVEPLYLQHSNSGLAIDFMHWQIPLSKKFRALKLWFTIRNYGITGMQKHIRESVRLGQKFETFVSSDPRFEIPAQRHLGLVVFRLVGENILTEKLLKRLNSRGNIHCVPAALKEKYVIRFTITSQYTTDKDIWEDWLEIKCVTDEILLSQQAETAAAAYSGTPRAKVPLKETKERNENFGTSLLLANSPNSPKIINGSFAAIFDAVDVLEEYNKTFGNLHLGNKKHMKGRIRGILMSGKQFSLDSHLDLVQVMESVESPGSPSNYRKSGPPLMEDLHKEEDWEDDDRCSSSSNKGGGGGDDEEDDDDSQLNGEKKCVKCGHDILKRH